VRLHHSLLGYCKQHSWHVFTVTVCGYDVYGMILLQTHLYIYSFLRGDTVEVLPLSRYALSPTMLPQLKDFWNSCCGIIFSAIVFFWISSVSKIIHPFKADFIFGNSQTLFGVKSREHSECSISEIGF